MSWRSPTRVKSARQRTEWFTGEVFGGYAFGSRSTSDGTGGPGGGAGFMLSAPTLKWGGFVWTTFETGGSFGGGLDWVFHTRIGWQLYLGTRAAQQLSFSVGAGLGLVGRYVVGPSDGWMDGPHRGRMVLTPPWVRIVAASVDGSVSPMVPDGPHRG